ncbi:TetR/AcrR family transcriptional regulator [Haliangium ochraceum]|uniref:Transcriptional regulator, TetR family n=1 Tax=Haliangium ochraceum (strain DSM 14365 / JCM 11303 / SMP-2) TaxID=502025 RepID=D0LFP8_HALO1|nr:TetR family transcriptional regulator [Haliangium ochraceum]ACY12682.1 transcriptional regulator, TetR family [Haliangium ochraceum DSM 14365]
MTLTKQRARGRAEKAQRRQDILTAARALLDERRFNEIKMIDVARAAELAKGTVFSYFPTKEALFLELLEQLLAEWLDALVSAFDSAGAEHGDNRWSGERVARLFADTLATREPFIQLLTLLTSVLEQNVDLARVSAFKRRLGTLLMPAGERIEQRLDFVPAGAGATLLMRLYAIVVGLRQLCDPGEVAARALEEPELAPLGFDFERELMAMLTAYLRGLESATVA